MFGPHKLNNLQLIDVSYAYALYVLADTSPPVPVQFVWIYFPGAVNNSYV